VAQGLTSVRLPPVRAFHAAVTACEAQGVPPLPTTALHGALGHTLRRMACLQEHRQACPGCPLLGECAYVELFEPPAPPGGGGGVTDRAPPPLVIAPERTAFGAASMSLKPGDRLDFRIVLIGERAARHAALVRIAVGEAIWPGLGSHAASNQDREALRLDAFTLLDAQPEEAPAAAVIELLTPLRMKSGSGFARELEAGLFWRTLVRRAETLAALYGQPLEGVPAEPGFAVAATKIRNVRVERSSSRQQARMTWDGLVGSARLEGPGLADAWPLLRFGERVQVGKGTSFGCGRYRLKSRG